MAAIGLWALATWSAAMGVSAAAPASLPAPARAYAQAAPGADVGHSPLAPLCDPNWDVVASANAGVYSSYFNAIAVVSAGDIWAVGHYYNDTVDQTLAEHWNGTQWSVVSSSNVGTQGNRLTGVAALSSTDVWAVGRYFDGTTTEQTLVEHWDGSAWSVVSSPNVSSHDNYLTAVAAISGSDVWAVGGYSNNMTRQTLVEHWNGSVWIIVYSPNPATNYNDLNGIVAVSSSDVWAVGEYSGGTPFRTLTEHWNGTQWSVVNSPNVGSEDNNLNGIDAVSSTDIWAVGLVYSGSTRQTLAEHWNGSVWSVVNTPNAGASDNYLNGVAAVSGSDVWAAGVYFTSTVDQTLVEHWDGNTWSVVSSPNGGSQNNNLNGVAAVSASDVWAVGYYQGTSTSQTLAERYNPCVPPTPTPTSCPIQYSDVPAGSTFYTYIHCLACRGIVNGYPDGTFKPNNPVTRGQLSKIVSNSAGYGELHLDRTFQDVPVGSTFYQYIERLATRGFISGYPCGGANEPCVPPTNLPYFRPNANVTRGQTSKIVASAKGLPSPPPGQQSFQDVPEGSTFWQWIDALATTGAISGYPCGNPEPCVPPGNLPYFRPNANVTRGQSTKIVGNTFFPNCQTPGDAKR